jgi:hypothetical protein
VAVAAMAAMAVGATRAAVPPAAVSAPDPRPPRVARRQPLRALEAVPTKDPSPEQVSRSPGATRRHPPAATTSARTRTPCPTSRMATRTTGTGTTATTTAATGTGTTGTRVSRARLRHRLRRVVQAASPMSPRTPPMTPRATREAGAGRTDAIATTNLRQALPPAEAPASGPDVAGATAAATGTRNR